MFDGGPSITFSVSQATCGDLDGDRYRDMAVGMALDQGTGGSPRVWAVFAGDPRGGYTLRRAVIRDRYLLCRLAISERTLLVRSIATYEGANSKCSSLRRYRLQRGGQLVPARTVGNGR